MEYTGKEHDYCNCGNSKSIFRQICIRNASVNWLLVVGGNKYKREKQENKRRGEKDGSNK